MTTPIYSPRTNLLLPPADLSIIFNIITNEALYDDAIAIDFETYFDPKDKYSLRFMSPDEYVNDNRFDPYCVSLQARGPNPLNYVGPVKDAPWHLVHGRPLVAHNARFDHSVLNRCIEMGLVPEVDFSSFDCTSDMALFFRAGRSLAAASRQLNNHVVSKEYRGISAQKTWSTFTKEELDEVIEANVADCEACLALWKKYGPSWPVLEKDISRFSRLGSMRGVKVDMESLSQGIKKLKTLQFEAGKVIPWDWSGKKTPDSPLSRAKQCRKEGIEVPASTDQNSKEWAEWVETYGGTRPWVQALADWRKANVLLNKLLVIKNRVESLKGADEPTFTFSLKYHGAHTGRSSGENKFNMQNMNRSSIFDVDLRGMFIPGRDKSFIISDLGQIEPRVLNWMAGNSDFLKMVEDGIHPYEVHARLSGMWHRPETLKESNLRLYTLAKSRLIALGYGTGWQKFIDMVRSYGEDPLDLFAGETTDEERSRFVSFLEFCKNEEAIAAVRELIRNKDPLLDVWVNSYKQVSDFRRTNEKITSFWGSLHTDFGSSAYNKSPVYKIELPSGRDLSYFTPIKANGTDLKARIELGNSSFYKFYGGHLAENVTQAIARDVFFHNANLVYSNYGYMYTFTVHDEGVWVVPRKEEDIAAERIHQCMSSRPEWAKTLPVAADTRVETKFVK